MRNLKRALSLTLASVMLLGMMVVGSSAAGYPDVSEEENIEAIEVLQAVGVMGGDENGNFNPDDYVTREQMAVIMAQLLKLDYNYYKGTNPFSDVPEWAAPYVAACAANGVTAGIGGGLYGSKQNIQAVQAALMMLKALGYFQYPGDYEGGYILATVKQGSEIGLFDGIDSNADSALTRNEVAQMALNALQADMVSFTGDPGMEYTGSNGEKWSGGYRAEYTPRTSTLAKYQAIESRSSDVSGDANHRGQYYIQLGEELYDGDLKLNSNATDEFGRPSRYWEYDSKAIGTYMKKEIIRAEYNAKVTGKMLYELLGSDTVNSIKRGGVGDYTLSIAIDGESRKDFLKNTGDGDGSEIKDFYFDIGKIVKGNTDAVGGTGNGVLTQVFIDSNKKTVDIAIINTYLAKANADYAAKQDKATFTVYGVEDITAGSAVDLVKNTSLRAADGKAVTTPLSVSSEDFDVEDVKEDDIFLVTVAEGEIQTMTKPNVLAETEIDAFKTGSNVTVGGTKYDYASTAKYDDEVLDQYTNSGVINLEDKTYNVYLDKYSYVIGVEEVEASNNYVFITGYDGNYSNLANRVADVGAIFLDGTMKTIKVKTKDSSEALFDGTIEYGAKGTTAADGSTKLDSNGNGVVDSGSANVDEETYTAAIINTWCTYTVNDNDEYTLTIAGSNPNQKVAQSVQSAHGGQIKIDTKRVQLLDNTGSNYVFGNDKTVYINTELERLKVDDTNYAIIIDDIQSVTVGTRNVSLEVNDKTNPDPSNAQVTPASANFTPIYEIYTLYKTNNRDIIGVVTLDAEDSGTNSVYAYVYSDKVKQERWDKTDKEHVWTREVIIDGVKTEVTYAGDTLKYIGQSASGDNTTADTMDQGFWYELKMDSKNHVRKVVKLNFSAANNNKYQNQVASIVGVWNAGNNVDIVWTNTVNGSDPVNKLSFSDGTLWTSARDKTGISVDENVKVVVCNANGAGDPFDEVEDGYNGYSGVTSAINDLNGNFSGYVSAVYDGGKAKVLIFNCTTPDPNYNGGGVVEDDDEEEETGGEAGAKINENKLVITDVVAIDNDYQDAIGKALRAAGMRVTGWTEATPGTPAANDKVTAVDDKGTVFTFEYGTAAASGTRTDYYTIKVDGTVIETVEKGEASTKKWSDIIPETKAGTGYVDGSGAYQAYGTTGDPISNNMTGPIVIKPGYVKASVGALVNGGANVLTQEWEAAGVTPAATLSAVPVKVGAVLKGTIAFGTTGITDSDNDTSGKEDTIAIAITGGADATLTVAGYDAFANKSDDNKTLTFKVKTAVTSTSFTWSIKAGEADITNVVVTYTQNT